MTKQPDITQLFDLPIPLKEREIIGCLKTLQSFAQELPTYQEHPRYHAVVNAVKQFMRAVESDETHKRTTEKIEPSIEHNQPTAEQTEASATETTQTTAQPSQPTTGIRLLHRRHCYACKQAMFARHPQYDAFCVPCGEINWTKRHQSADLSERCAIVTGGRSKIGYATSLKLLRAGAQVLVTTRFPKHAAERFAKEHDFNHWRSRLIIHGLDLRSFPAIAAFTQEVPQLLGRLDILINNAAQTIRRPPRYYRPLIADEATPFSSPDLADLLSPSSRRAYEACRLLPSPFAESETFTHTLSTEITTHTTHTTHTPNDTHTPNTTPPARHAQTAQEHIPPAEISITPWLPPTGVTSLADIPIAWRQHASFLSGVPFLPDDLHATSAEFPHDQYNRYGEYADMRDHTSWEMEIDQVHPFELFEVHAINAMAPFLLMRDLRPLMLETPDPMRFIVNVTSTEGQFSDLKDPLRTTNKSARHPHTNMTKAALNMLTLSGASADAKFGIFRTAVDPGWASIENARIIREQWFALGIDAPLTIEDAAARLCDPIFSPLLHHTPPLYGVLLKDYRLVHW